MVSGANSAWDRSRIRDIRLEEPRDEQGNRGWIYLEWPTGIVEGWLDSIEYIEYDFYEETTRYRGGPSVSFGYSPSQTTYIIDGSPVVFKFPGESNYIIRHGKDSYAER